MKSRKKLGALAGVMLCGLGFWLALATPYRRQTVVTDAASCRMPVDIIEPLSGAPQGSVLLLHRISANKKFMFYFAQGFSQQGLRVFYPAVPAHRRTPAPSRPPPPHPPTTPFYPPFSPSHTAR